MRQVSFRTHPSLAVGKPETLFDGAYFAEADATSRNYDLAPDGRFLMLKDAADGPAETSRSRLILVQNWTEELSNLFP